MHSTKGCLTRTFKICTKVPTVQFIIETMAVRELRPDLLQKAMDVLNEDREQRDAYLKVLRDWADKQPHNLAKLDDQMLLTFLRGCKFNLERTKTKLDLYFTLRTTIPEFYKDRNLKDSKFQALVNAQ